MIIYNYNENGEFVRSSTAKQDPLGGGFLVPANATTIEPITAGNLEASVFKNGTWTIIPDYRESTDVYYYTETKEPVEFKLGDTPDASMSLEMYTEAELLQQAKDVKIASVDAQTVIDIELLVGNNNKQKDLLAEASILLEKKFDGTITAEEIIRKDELNSLWFQVSALKVSGNDREAQVALCTTIAEVEVI